MPIHRQSTPRPNRVQRRRYITRREFHQCRRNFTFSQCNILQWSRRSTRMMLFAMVFHGVHPDSRIFRAHRDRHHLLRVFLNFGVSPYSEELRAQLPILMALFYTSWAQCLFELERFQMQ